MKNIVRKVIALLLIGIMISCSFIYGDENIGESEETPIEPVPPITEPETPIEPIEPQPPFTEPENPMPPATEPSEPPQSETPTVPSTPTTPQSNIYDNTINIEVNSDEDVQGKEDLLLESMSTNAGTLKPEFSPEHLNYIVYVEDASAYCDIEAVSKNSDREVIYRGEYTFTEKVLERQVYVIGDDNEYLRYTIKFIRVDPYDFFAKTDQKLYSLGLTDKIVNKSKDLAIEVFNYNGKNINILKSKEYDYSITMGTDYENNESITWLIYDKKTSSFLPAKVKVKGKKMTFEVKDGIEIIVTSKDDKLILKEKIKVKQKDKVGAIAIYGVSAFILALLILSIIFYIKNRDSKKEKNRKKPYLTLDEKNNNYKGE